MKWKEFKKLVKKLEEDTNFKIVLPDNAKEQFKALSTDDRKKSVNRLISTVLTEYTRKKHNEKYSGSSTFDDTNESGNSGNGSVETVLHDRGIVYGDFEDVATLSQSLKQSIFKHLNYNFDTDALPDTIKEGLEMIIHKLVRVVNGDPYYIDNYRDIVGYAQLIIEHLSDLDGATDSVVSKITRVDGKWQ